MERNLLAREINTLSASPWLTDSFSATFSEREAKLFPTGRFYGFLKEKSFLRKEDLKTKKTFDGSELYYPNKQMVDVLGENDGWLLVEGSASYTKNGVTYVYSERNVVQKLQGWVKKSWVDIRESRPPAPTADEHVGQIVNYRAKVRAQLGIKLHRTPNPSTKIIDSRIYPQNSTVTIIGLPSRSNDPNWYRIRTEDGKEGWIESRYVTQIPNAALDLTIKEYYIVRSGDMLEPLVKNRYPDYDIKTGDDLRTIVHAFSILNDGNPSIYYQGESDSWWRDHVFDRDMAGTRRVYASIKLRKGGLIYFPTESYINYLKDTGKVGQRPDWKNHAIDFAKAIKKFIDGFIEGCQTIIAGIWEDIKSLFSLSFFKDIYNLIKEIITKPLEFLESIKDMIAGLFTKVNSYLREKSYQKKFYGVGLASGLICGMVVQNAVGGSKLIELARLHKIKGISKLIKKVEKLDPHSDEFQKAEKRLKQKVEAKVNPNFQGRKWTAKEISQKIAKGTKFADWSKLEKKAHAEYFKVLTATGNPGKAGEKFHEVMKAAARGADRDTLGFQIEIKTSLKKDPDYLADFASKASAQAKDYAFSFQDATGFVKGRIVTLYLMNFRPPVKIILN